VPDFKPPYPKPPDADIAAAERGVADVLAEMPNEIVLASELVTQMAERTGCSIVAAAWAVYGHYQQGRLALEVGQKRVHVVSGVDSPTYSSDRPWRHFSPYPRDAPGNPYRRRHRPPVPPAPAPQPGPDLGEAVPWHRVVVRPRDALWEWWRGKPRRAKGKAPENPGPPGPAAASLDARALAVFIEHPDWTKKRIAAHLGCNEKSLSPRRCPKLAAAVRACRSSADPPCGSKSPEGDLEAWEDDPRVR
jgi:hypothetical protein